LQGSGHFPRHGPRRLPRPERPRCPVPARGTLPAPVPRPLMSPRPAPRCAPGSLAAAGARLQRQRGPPGFVCVALGVFCPGSGSSGRRQGGSGGGHRPLAPPPSQGFSSLSSLSPSALRSSLSSLRPAPRSVSRYCFCPRGGSGGGRGAAIIRNKEESFWVLVFFFFSPFPLSLSLSLQSGLGSCATSDLLGPADFPLVNSGQEEARLIRPYLCFHFRNSVVLYPMRAAYKGPGRVLGCRFKTQRGW
jgi:hypothetical protein